MSEKATSEPSNRDGCLNATSRACLEYPMLYRARQELGVTRRTARFTKTEFVLWCANATSVGGSTTRVVVTWWRLRHLTHPTYDSALSNLMFPRMLCAVHDDCASMSCLNNASAVTKASSPALCHLDHPCCQTPYFAAIFSSFFFS